MIEKDEFICLESADELVEYCEKMNIRIRGNPEEGFLGNDREPGYVALRNAIGPRRDYPFTSSGHNLSVKEDLFKELNDILLSDDPKGLDRLLEERIERAFACLDIVGFSKKKPNEQAEIIRTVVQLRRNESLWPRHDFQHLPGNTLKSLEAELCIGDGYIYVFTKAFDATLFACHLATLIEFMQLRDEFPYPFKFKCGVHVGSVERFYDPGRHDWNYVGEGINGVNRVLSVIPGSLANAIYLSSAVRATFLRRTDELAMALKDNISNEGQLEDKHGIEWHVFSVNHTDVYESNIYRDMIPTPD